jgi:hypothetical protein
MLLQELDHLEESIRRQFVATVQQAYEFSPSYGESFV